MPSNSIVQSLEIGRQAARQREEDAYVKARRPIENAYKDRLSEQTIRSNDQTYDLNAAQEQRAAAQEQRAAGEQAYTDQGRVFAAASKFTNKVADMVEANPGMKPSDVLKTAPPEVLKFIHLDTPDAQAHFAEVYDADPKALRTHSEMYGGGRKLKTSEPVETDEGAQGFLQQFEDGSFHFVPGYKSKKSATGGFTIAGKRFDANGNMIVDESDALATLEGAKASNRAYGTASGKNEAEDLPWSQADANKAADVLGNRAARQTNLDDAIDRAIAATNDSSAGFAGASKAVPGTPAANLAAQLNTIGSIIGLDELQRLRDNSKTGGALGQVTEAEHKLLQSVIASVDQGQSPSILRKQLAEVKRKARESWDRVQAAYDRDLAQYGPKGAGAKPAAAKRVTLDDFLKE